MQRFSHQSFHAPRLITMMAINLFTWCDFCYLLQSGFRFQVSGFRRWNKPRMSKWMSNNTFECYTHDPSILTWLAYSCSLKQRYFIRTVHFQPKTRMYGKNAQFLRACVMMRFQIDWRLGLENTNFTVKVSSNGSS